MTDNIRRPTEEQLLQAARETNEAQRKVMGLDTTPTREDSNNE